MFCQPLVNPLHCHRAGENAVTPGFLGVGFQPGIGSAAHKEVCHKLGDFIFSAADVRVPKVEMMGFDRLVRRLKVMV